MNESLHSRATQGARWLAVAMVLLTVLSFGQNIILSRLLERRDFGLVGMMWAVLGLAQVFHDMGLSNAVIQRKEVNQEQLSTVFWISGAAGLCLFLLVLAAGPLIASYYREPELAGLVPWVAATFFLQAFVQPFQAIGQRHLRFASLAVTDVASTTTALLVSTSLAWAGWGAKSMVLGTLASVVTRGAMLSFQQRDVFWPQLQCRPRQILPMLHFGLFQMGDKCLNYLGANLDYILIGRVWGADTLAIYRLAYETALRPLAIINPIFNTVAYPIFARKQDDIEALRCGLEQGLRLVSVLAFPVMVGLAVTSEWTIRLLYGAKWESAAVILRILCLAGAVRCVLNLGGAILLARGLAKRSFWLTVLNLVLFGGAYSFAVYRGAEELAWSANVVLLFVAVVTYRWVYGDTIGMPVLRYLKALWGASITSLGMGLGVWLLRISGVMIQWPLGWQLAGAVLFGGALFISLNFMFNRRAFEDLRKIMTRG